MGRRHTDEKGEEQLLVCFKGYARLSADIKRGAANIELVAQDSLDAGRGYQLDRSDELIEHRW
jgi:hypothetical protein